MLAMATFLYKNRLLVLAVSKKTMLPLVGAGESELPVSAYEYVNSRLGNSL